MNHMPINPSQHNCSLSNTCLAKLFFRSTGPTLHQTCFSGHSLWIGQSDKVEQYITIPNYLLYILALGLALMELLYFLSEMMNKHEEGGRETGRICWTSGGKDTAGDICGLERPFQRSFDPLEPCMENHLLACLQDWRWDLLYLLTNFLLQLSPNKYFGNRLNKNS